MASAEPSIFSPEDFHSYMASRNKVRPDRLAVPAGLLMTYSRRMFGAARRRIRGRVVDWYYDRRLAVGSFKGVDLAVLCSFIGASAASTMLEEMIASGARLVLEVGTCGGLVPAARVGDVIVADEAFSDEGTSAHYSDRRRFPASERLTGGLTQVLRTSGMRFKTGGVWTTDAPYRETVSKLRAFRRRGAVCVNMETSALFAVAKFRQVEVGSLQIVSDLVGEKVWRPAFHEKVVAERTLAASRLAVEVLAGL
jgi:uridine phosphorylase